MAPQAKSAARLLDFPQISGYVRSVEENQAKRIALVVEGIVGLAQVILDVLIKDEPAACKVIVKHDAVEALDYLLCRRSYAGRDPNVMPCVTLVDLVLPRSGELGLLREMRD